MLDRLSQRWAAVVVRFPWTITLISLVIAIIGGYYTTQLTIRSNFAALLPENSDSVKDLKAISKRMGGMGELIVMVQGDDFPAMKRFADDMAAALQKYPTDQVKFIEYRIDSQKAFFDRNKWLYLEEQDLTDLRDQLKQRIAKEKLKASGLYIDLEDDDDEATAKDGEKVKDGELDFDKKREEYNKQNSKFDRFKDGYLTSEDGKSLIIVVKTPGTATSVSFAQKIVASVDDDIRRLDPSKYHPSLQVNLTGSLTTLVEEYFALRDDILVVSNICVLLVLLAVILYYRSIRMALILSVGLVASLLTTFGLTKLHIGYLTTSTAFLASIVAGNGINPGIYFMARYREERGDGADIEGTLHRTFSGIFKSVATAMAAAAASYASLLFVDFRGFNQFGFIGGVGMLICLLFAFILNPALTVLMERYWPFKPMTRQEHERGRIFSHSVAWLVERRPGVLFAAGVTLTLASIVLLAFFLRDPYEYNFKVLRNQISREEGSGKRSFEAEKILGERSTPHVILADHAEQAPRIAQVLKPHIKDEKTNPDGVFKTIKTVSDHIPGSVEEQQRKLILLADIRSIIEKNTFDFLKKEDKDLLNDLKPPADLTVVGMDDLPEGIIRQYIENDGTKGTPLFVYMADGMSVWNGHDLIRFADVVRKVDLPSGETVRSSGHSVIFADMLAFIAADGPKATIMGFILSFLVVLAIFRTRRHVVLLTLSMLSGVAMMMGISIAFGQKLNFLNFIAIPIEFGIGVDYAVNIYSRYLEEGPGSMGKVLHSTGGAVMITSATTVIGYAALWLSMNGAINTFGTLANIGELTCLTVAVFTLPAYLVLRERRQSA